MSDRPLRIAILGSRGYPSTYGGFETFVRRIGPWLVARGHAVVVYGRGGRTKVEREIDGLHVVETRGLQGKTSSTVTHGLTGALHCLRHRPDVVLVLNVANGPAILLLKLRRIPVVVNVDGIEWERDKWGPVARWCFRLGARMTARFADVLVADSKEVVRVWERDFGVSPTFIPYGADVVEGLPSERIQALGLDPGGYALAVARLVPENNIALFVDAMEQLEWSVPAVVVGQSTYANGIEPRLQAHMDSGELLWLGHLDDQDLLGELWANAGVYFHGHSVGGTNPALLQALGFGAPTVAVDTPYNREVLDDDLQVVAAETEHVAHAVRSLINDQPERQRRAAAGREVIDSRYRWVGILEAYEAQLGQACRKQAIG